MMVDLPFETDFHQPFHQPEVQPLFLVVDVGESMKGIGTPRLNQISVELFRMIAADPTLDDKVQVCVIEFAQEFEVLFPVSPTSNVDQIPGFLAAESPSSYGRMFRRLHGEMYAAVAAIERSGRRVRRPWVFLVSQGAPPVETWRDQHSALCGEDNPARPWIFPLGFAGVDWGSLLLISNFGGFRSDRRFAVDLAITPIGEVLKELSMKMISS